MLDKVRTLAAGTLLVAGGATMAQCPPERLVPPVGWHDGKFGNRVRVEGDVVVIAEPSNDQYCGATTCANGAVQVYRRAGGAWSFEQTVFHSRISERDTFGGGLSLDGPNRFAASALSEDVAGRGAGAVYIFEQNGEAWREVAEILPVEPQWSNGFGLSLALRGDTLVVGSPRFQTAAAAPGAAWVYRLIDGRWQFTQKLVPPDPRNGARFAHALAMDGEWLTVGAYADDEMGYGAGAVYIYHRQEGGAYELRRKLFAPGDPALQVFGYAVAIDADTLAVGATNGPHAEARGALYIFELQSGEWRHTATLEHDDPVDQDALGASVSLRSDIIVAGAPLQPLPGSTNRGVAYVFHRRADGSWRHAAKLVPDLDDRSFGRAVATDGASVLLGAPGALVAELRMLRTGAARIFDLPCLLCRADLDGDGELTFLDFLAFQNLFAAGDPAADFDGDGALTFFDFLAFQNEFAAGCG